ncbi:MAG: hypothetical protein ABI927_07705 [Gaiellaceae bacterium]
MGVMTEMPGRRRSVDNPSMKRPRRFWIEIAMGTVCWLIAMFTLGYAVGSHEATGNVIDSLRAHPQIFKDSSDVLIYGSSYARGFWIGAALATIGTVALILAYRSRRRISN